MNFTGSEIAKIGLLRNTAVEAKAAQQLSARAVNHLESTLPALRRAAHQSPKTNTQ